MVDPVPDPGDLAQDHTHNPVGQVAGTNRWSNNARANNERNGRTGVVKSGPTASKSTRIMPASNPATHRPKCRWEDQKAKRNERITHTTKMAHNKKPRT